MLRERAKIKVEIQKILGAQYCIVKLIHQSLPCKKCNFSHNRISCTKFEISIYTKPDFILVRKKPCSVKGAKNERGYSFAASLYPLSFFANTPLKTIKIKCDLKRTRHLISIIVKILIFIFNLLVLDNITFLITNTMLYRQN